MAIEARKVDPPALAEGKARGLNQSKGPLSDRPEPLPASHRRPDGLLTGFHPFAPKPSGLLLDPRNQLTRVSLWVSGSGILSASVAR